MHTLLSWSSFLTTASYIIQKYLNICSVISYSSLFIFTTVFHAAAIALCNNYQSLCARMKHMAILWNNFWNNLKQFWNNLKQFYFHKTWYRIYTSYIGIYYINRQEWHEMWAHISSNVALLLSPIVRSVTALLILKKILQRNRNKKKEWTKSWFVRRKSSFATICV